VLAIRAWRNHQPEPDRPGGDGAVGSDQPLRADGAELGFGRCTLLRPSHDAGEKGMVT